MRTALLGGELRPAGLLLPDCWSICERLQQIKSRRPGKLAILGTEFLKGVALYHVDVPPLEPRLQLQDVLLLLARRGRHEFDRHARALLGQRGPYRGWYAAA